MGPGRAVGLLGSGSPLLTSVWLAFNFFYFDVWQVDMWLWCVRAKPQGLKGLHWTWQRCPLAPIPSMSGTIYSSLVVDIWVTLLPIASDPLLPSHHDNQQ